MAVSRLLGWNVGVVIEGEEKTTTADTRENRRQPKKGRLQQVKCWAFVCVLTFFFLYVIPQHRGEYSQERAPLSTPSDQHLFLYIPAEVCVESRCGCYYTQALGYIFYLLVIRTLSFFFK